MNDSQSIVLYRSRVAQNIDEFWAENPEYILYGIAAFVVIVTFFVLASWLEKFYHKGRYWWYNKYPSRARNKIRRNWLKRRSKVDGEQ